MVHLSGAYQPSPAGTYIVTEFLPPGRSWPSPMAPRNKVADQKVFLVTFLMYTLEVTEVDEAEPPVD